MHAAQGWPEYGPGPATGDNAGIMGALDAARSATLLGSPILSF
jgi:hypothetical protein